jgi:2-isopropylmalate synthase
MPLMEKRSLKEKRRLTIFDTTLRDGDQAAGCAFSAAQKLLLARALEKAGVDCIEAGFPSSSKADFDACRLIATEIFGPRIAVMTRAVLADIRLSAEALAGSGKGMIHLSLPVSRLHIETKLRKSESGVLSLASECVRFAAGFAPFVEAGAEDATRADRNFLVDYCCAVTEAGAHIVNIADTVGYTVPHEFGALVRHLLKSVPAFRTGRSVLSVHCHNDFGLANANTLAGIAAGCSQIEVTALGIGERAGNAALEEIDAILRARSDLYPVETVLSLPGLGNLTRLVCGILGTDLSPFKPVTGRNARAHASGIHQQGTLLDKATYSSVPGSAPERIVLSRHSGKEGLRAAIRHYAGIEVAPEMLGELLAAVKDSPETGPLYGVTELLTLLRAHRLIPMDPTRRLSLEVTETAAEAKTVCSVTAKLGQNVPSGLAITHFASGSAWPDTLLALVSPIHPGGILLVTLSFSGFQTHESTHGDSFPHASRLYIEAIAGGSQRRYTLERTGADPKILFLDCLLDILNAEICLTETLRMRYSSEVIDFSIPGL